MPHFNYFFSIVLFLMDTTVGEKKKAPVASVKFLFLAGNVPAVPDSLSWLESFQHFPLNGTATVLIDDL